MLKYWLQHVWEVLAVISMQKKKQWTDALGFCHSSCRLVTMKGNVCESRSASLNVSRFCWDSAQLFQVQMEECSGACPELSCLFLSLFLVSPAEPDVCPIFRSLHFEISFHFNTSPPEFIFTFFCLYTLTHSMMLPPSCFPVVLVLNLSCN